MLYKRSMKSIAAAISVIGAGFVFDATTNSAHAGCSRAAYMGSVCITASTFCPEGFLEANGQLLAISNNQSLYSLLGTAYGGDGRTKFGLPNLQRSAVSSLGISGPRRVEKRDRAARQTPSGGTASTQRIGMLYCISVEGAHPPRP